VPDLEFDIPYRELGFHGVPGRTTTFLMPTVHCLVQLLEPPFFILSLDEVRRICGLSRGMLSTRSSLLTSFHRAQVDIAHFERVQFSLKNFDLVFVFKDLSRQPAFISAIPVQNLDPIKDWLEYVLSLSLFPSNLSHTDTLFFSNIPLPRFPPKRVQHQVL